MKTKRTLVVMFMLVLVLMAGVFPGGAAFAEGGGDPLALRFVCDETVASVTVYDQAGLPLPVGADGIHHLTPGTYFYSATAEGYESTGLQAFTIPADAAGDQELRISLTPVPGSVPPDAAAPRETPSDVSVPSQTPVNAPDPNAPEENPEDDGKLRIRPVDGSLTLTVERETKTESAVPPEVQNLLEGKQKPLQTADGKPVEKKLWLKTPDAEELYLDRLAVEKEIGYYTTDWTVLNLTDEEGDRKNLLPASGWYDVTVSGPATEQYRDYEPVFALLTLHWNEEGEIIDRDVQILETTHTPTKSSWSFSTDTLSTLVIAVPTDRPYIDETAKKPALTERTLVSGDGKVEVSGLLPEDAQLVVVEIPLSFAAELYSIRTGEAKAEEEILFAYDISILSGGEKFQPEDFGESVRVSVGGLNTGEEPSDVLHVKADAVNGAGALDLSAVGAAGSAESELLPVSAEDGVVAFETEGFSVFIGATKGAPLRGVAASGDCGDNLTWKLDENGTLTISGTGAIWSYLEWGDHRNNIKSVVIENGVTSIGGSAFADCSNLKNVTFAPGSQLASIGDYAFYNCSDLRSIEIPSGVTTIGAYAFSYCDSPYLSSVTIPASVTGIGKGAFSECDDLRYITFGGKLEQWRDLSPSSFIDDYDSGLTIYCSDSCGNDLSWKLENGTLTISGTGAMFDYELERTPWHHDGIFSLNLEEGVTSIGDNAFFAFRTLSRLVIPSGVTSIGENAFGDCWILQNATIPASVRSIGEWAFYLCDRLEYICYVGTRENWDKISSSSYVHAGCKIIAACADLDDGGTVAFDTESGVTVTATPNSGYSFVNWTENGNVVTGEDGKPVGASYSFNVVADRNLVAHFVKPVSVNLQVTKKFKDWSKAPQGFTFNLAAVTENAPMPANTTAKATRDSTTASFGEIAYDAAGEYKYTIAEVNGHVPGVTYDTTPHEVVVTVTKNNDTNALSATVKYDGENSLTVENTYSGGGLTVSKTVDSRVAGDTDQEFQFTVELSDKSINGTYGDMTFSNGVATFKLKDREAKTANSLPAGVSYTVTEEDTAGFTMNKSGDTGTISATQSAATFTNKRIFEYTTDGTSATITKYWGDDASFSIPQTLTVSGGTCPVTAIGDLAFFQCVNLGSVEIPSSVTTIRSKAFEYCTNLTSVTFADGSQLERIGDYAFSGSGLGSIQIPSSVTSIGASAFLSCSNLESVTFAEGSALTSMGVSAFQLCKKLTSVTIPLGVTIIENYAFDTCTGLTDVTIPSSVTSIGNYAFNACSRLGSIKIPAGVKSIGVDAFRDCESLESVTIPSSVTSIGNFAFCSCSKLESVTIPSSVTSMGESAFQHCKKLTSVTIERSDPATVLAIGSDAFLCGTDSATLSWTGNTPAGQGVVFTVSPDTAGYSISGTTLSWNANPNSTAEATLRATFVQLPSAKLEVTKEFNDWSKADSFTFNLAAVTENAPLPANTTATATKNNSTASFGEITYNSVGTYKYTITEEDGGLPGVSYDRALHEVIVTVSKAPTTNVLTAAVEYDGQPYLIVTNLYSGGNLKVSKTVVSDNAVDQQRAFDFTVTLDPGSVNGTYGDMTFTDGVATFTLKDGETKNAASLPAGVSYTVTEEAVDGFTTTKTGDTGEILEGQTASASFTNKLTPAIAPTITGPENLTLTYGYEAGNKLSVEAEAATDGTYDLGYQWYSCEDTVKTNPQKIDLATEASYAIPTGKSAETTEYYYCEVTATRTDNGQTATASSAVATVTINRVPAPTSLTDAQKPTPTAPTADGTPQALVIPPQELPTGYTGVKYSIDGGTNWTELNVVPTAIVPDTYVVQVLYVPDGNHTAIEGTPVKAVILPNYNVVEAESTSSWLKGSRDDAVIKVRLRGLSGKDDNSFQHFKSVAIDGAVLSEDSSALIQKDYKAEEGSTVITLHKKMLNRLSAGPHTVTITFDNGEVEAPLTILVPPGGYSPATGDSARISFWAALMVLAGLGFAGADYARRRLRRPRYVGKH